MKLLALILATSITLSPMEVIKPDVLDRVEGTIYVGDSRFNGMEMHLKKGEGFVVAKDSMGYKWLISDGYAQINQIKSNYPDIKEWTIVSGLGVNDLYNINNYMSFYKNLELGGDRVVVLSVNPTNNKRESLNTEIDSFNNQLENSGLEYFDTCEHLREIGFNTVDGVHYTKDTYKEIWNEINNYIMHEKLKEDEVYSDWFCK